MIETSSPRSKVTMWWMVWILTGALIQYLWPSLQYLMPVWEVYSHMSVTHIFFPLVFLLLGLGLLRRASGEKDINIVQVLLLNGALYGSLLLVMNLYRIHSYPRSVLLGTLFLSVFYQLGGLVVFRYLSGRFSKLLVGLSSVLCLLLIFVNFTDPGVWLGAAKKISSLKPALRTQDYLNTSYYQIRLDRFTNYVPVVHSPGGGMVSLEEGILLVTGDGKFYLIDRSDGFDKAQFQELAIEVPINFNDFAQAAPKGTELTYFRVAGIHHEINGFEIRIWVSHHFWNKEDLRTHVRVSTIAGTLEEFKTGGEMLKWLTLYETSPGLPFYENTRHGTTFAGLQIGGRIQSLDDKHLLVSIGDHELDGWMAEPAVSQDLMSPYGKILKINKETGSFEFFSIGHRNPQGLIISENGTIWSTEHGPQGGDELNIIEEDKNYGWPLVTLGTDYGDTIWPPAVAQASHEGYEYPIHAWLPSIGISNLVQVNSSLFPAWKDNLLIGSLWHQRLYRIQLHEGKVLAVEQIAIGERMRDIIQDRDGSLFVWGDDGTLVRIVPVLEEEKTGEMIFAQCLVCHSNNLTGDNLIAPDLKNVFGREIGKETNFAYSPALKNMRGKWNDQNLDIFLENPSKFASGSTMIAPGLNAAERQKVIEYLKDY